MQALPVHRALLSELPVPTEPYFRDSAENVRSYPHTLSRLHPPLFLLQLPAHHTHRLRKISRLHGQESQAFQTQTVSVPATCHPRTSLLHLREFCFRLRFPAIFEQCLFRLCMDPSFHTSEIQNQPVHLNLLSLH